MSAVALPPPVRVPNPPPVSPLPFGLPLQAGLAGLKRFTVDEYEAMVRAGLLNEDHPVELIEGYLVNKMPQNSPHSGSVFATQDILSNLLPDGWICRGQLPIRLSDGMPEPDLAVVRGDRRTYFTRQPVPVDFGIAIEVSDTTLAADRTDKQRTYARAGIPEFWIVNLNDRTVEVYTQPQPTAPTPGYATRTDYSDAMSVPVVLDGQPVAAVPVADLLP
jgi:Uma2 family endonuclease